MSTTLLLLAALTAVAAVWDVGTRRIPNELLLVGLLVGVVFAAWANGLVGVGLAVLGAAVGLASLYVPWTRGWVGGGDVKLLAVCGAFLGWKGVLVLVLVGSALHGFLTLGVLIAARVSQQPDKGAPFAPALALAVLVLAVARPALLLSP